MATGRVYILNKENQIIHDFPADWETCIANYFGKRDHRGRYYVAPEGIDVPFSRVPKRLVDVKRPTDPELDT